MSQIYPSIFFLNLYLFFLLKNYESKKISKKEKQKSLEKNLIIKIRRNKTIFYFDSMIVPPIPLPVFKL